MQGMINYEPLHDHWPNNQYTMSGPVWSRLCIEKEVTQTKLDHIVSGHTPIVVSASVI